MGESRNGGNKKQSTTNNEKQTFLTPLIRTRTYFSMFSGGKERVHWEQIG